MNSEGRFSVHPLSQKGRTLLDRMSSARRNRLRLAYFRAGAPFGPNTAGMGIWVLFGCAATVN
jgi:hypothetical protein